MQTNSRRLLDETVRRKDQEIFEITPIKLGGDPVDPQNKVVLARAQHIAAVRYWNEVIEKLRRTE